VQVFRHFFSDQNLQTFDIQYAFLSLTVAKLYTLKMVQFFGPPCNIITTAGMWNSFSSKEQLSYCLIASDIPYCVSQKSPLIFFCHFFPNDWEFLVQILHAYSTFLPIYDGVHFFLFTYLQLLRSYAMLSATIIIYWNCPPSVETLAGWSRHNFVIVKGNRKKIVIQRR